MRHRFSAIAVDNVLTWDQVVLTANLIASYGINFARWTQKDIYEKMSYEFTTLPLLGTKICNMKRVTKIPKVHHRIEATSIA